MTRAEFSDAFVAACDLRTASALTERVSREVCEEMRLILLQITSSALRSLVSIKRKHGNAHFSSLISDLPPIPLIRVPSLTQLVEDLAAETTLNFGNSGVFAQAAHDFRPQDFGGDLREDWSGPIEGVVMRDFLASEDSVFLTRGEVVQVLSPQLHGFQLVRKLVLSGNRVLGLVPHSLLRPYQGSVRQQQEAAATDSMLPT